MGSDKTRSLCVVGRRVFPQRALLRCWRGGTRVASVARVQGRAVWHKISFLPPVVQATSAGHSVVQLQGTVG